MEYTRLGSTGLRVSRIALGCTSYGTPQAGPHPWTLDEEAAADCFAQAVDLGITFWKTANTHQGGTSEEYVGRAIQRFTRREQVVLATTVGGHVHDGPGGGGLSRIAVMEQVQASLRRLDTDHLDILYVDRFDDQAPVEETMQALDDLVRAGTVRYLGACSMHAWQFAKLQTTARLHGWTTFSAMECQYNLLKREQEREMVPMCLDMGVGITAGSPLAQGRAARPWGLQTERSEHDQAARALDLPQDEAVVDAIGTVAFARGIPMALIAMAWLLGRPGVDSAIVGASRHQHLLDAADALEVTLSRGEVELLQRAYRPQADRW